MSAEKEYFQCRLRRGNSETVGWIEARAARSRFVEVLPSGEWWEVVEAFSHGLQETMLKAHQRMHRNSLPSVDAIR